MTEGLTRTQVVHEAPSEPTIQRSAEIGIDTVHYDQIPIDVYRFFNVNLGTMDKTEITELQEISKWAFNDSETVGDALVKLRNLEMKLGLPSGKETRQQKLSNWVRMERQIVDLRKRQEALNGR